MNKMLQVIFTANNLSTGIMLPVLTLVLLEKGADLQTLPLLMAVYSLTVLLLELPSGILADMFGRRTVFLISCGFQLISFTLLLVSCKLIQLVPAIIFFGLGRAFSSGSLDAIIIDRTLENGSADDLPRVTSRLAVLESVGLAAGSVIGGLAASVFGTYNSIIIIRLILTAIVALLCLIFVRELTRHKADETVPVPTLAGMVRQGRQLITNYHKLGLILIGVFFTGFFLFTMETYWQPAFTSMPHNGKNTWLLGIITFIGFLSVTAGSLLSHKLLNSFKNSWWNIFIISRIIMAAIIMVFAAVSGTAGFIILYAGIYLLLGTGNISESSLINKFTPNDMRASMLSLNSLVSQIGGLCSSLFSSVMVIRLGFSGIWLVAGILIACYAVFLAVITVMPMIKSIIPTLYSKR